MTGGRENEFPLSNYPPGVTGTEPELTGEDTWHCQWVKCYKECPEDFTFCTQHVVQTFFSDEMQQRPIKDQIEIVSLLDDLVEDEMRRMKG